MHKLLQLFFTMHVLKICHGHSDVINSEVTINRRTDLLRISKHKCIYTTSTLTSEKSHFTDQPLMSLGLVIMSAWPGIDLSINNLINNILKSQPPRTILLQ